LKRKNELKNSDSIPRYTNVLLWLIYLKIIVFYKKIQLLKVKIIKSHINKNSKLFIEGLDSTISKIYDISKNSKSVIINEKPLGEKTNSTYLINVLQSSDNSTSSRQLVVKHFELKGTYFRTSTLLKLYGKKIFSLRPVPSESQRLMSELFYFKNLKGIRLKIPEIIYLDSDKKYFISTYIKGMNIDDFIFEIKQNMAIEKWQILQLEEIGSALAEINLNLNIVHGDTAPSNWIKSNSTKDLFLCDWETAGCGDPAWDLAHLIYEIAAKFDDEMESVRLFEKILNSIIKGYKSIGKTEKISQRFPEYWTTHAFSVSPIIHERIFQHLGRTQSRKFKLLRMLNNLPVFKYYSPYRKRPLFNDLIHHFLCSLLSLYNILNLFSGGNRSHISFVVPKSLKWKITV
jgi:thiamine kinase-like enzyme